MNCMSSGSTRRVDIIAIHQQSKRALVLDPTIRFERDVTQGEDVDREKKEIYEPCLPYLSEHYNVALENWTVEGILFGSRRTISKHMWLYLKSLCISQQVLQDITLDILKDSLHILHHHLYVN